MKPTKPHSQHHKFTKKESNISSNRPNSDHPKTVYIGNLRYNIKEDALMRIFGKFGKVKQVNIVKGPNGEASKGIAFVQMSCGLEADKAIRTLNGKVIGQRTVKVSEAIDRYAPKPNDKKISDPKKEVPSFKSSTIKRKRRRPGSGLEELFKATGRR